MGAEAGEPPAIFNFALGSVKAKAAAGTDSESNVNGMSKFDESNWGDERNSFGHL
jgi:hypothetical protein